MVDCGIQSLEINEFEANKITGTVISQFANMAMRTIGVAYKDVGKGLDIDALDESVLDADGSPAFKCGIELILLGIVGIEDPLRPEVAPAIKSCTELASMCAW